MRPFHFSTPASVRSLSPDLASPVRSWFIRGLLLALVAAGPSFAVTRTLKITTPTTAVAGSKVSVSVYASTDAGGGERIGFFHGEFSVDDGKSWTAFCYEQNIGPTATRIASIKAGIGGSKILVRVRIAFRGGKAGDVDFTGTAISWDDTWANWHEPPAKIATMTVAP